MSYPNQEYTTHLFDHILEDYTDCEYCYEQKLEIISTWYQKGWIRFDNFISLLNQISDSQY